MSKEYDFGMRRHFRLIRRCPYEPALRANAFPERLA
jgi:hypothetical protein